ncbi:MAG: hypothetical protein AAGI17_00655 [Planctomycetota bacterium]
MSWSAFGLAWGAAYGLADAAQASVSMRLSIGRGALIGAALGAGIGLMVARKDPVRALRHTFGNKVLAILSLMLFSAASTGTGAEDAMAIGGLVALYYGGGLAAWRRLPDAGGPEREPVVEVVLESEPEPVPATHV